MCSFPHKEMHVCTHTHALLHIKCTKLNFRICIHRHMYVCTHIYMYIFMCVYIDVTYWTQKIYVKHLLNSTLHFRTLSSKPQSGSVVY